jgi:hypothetical protein
MRTKMIRGGLVVLACVASFVPTVDASADAWSNANCPGGSSAITTWKRSQATAYAQPPLHEGYALDGGCYRLNNKDDTPTLAADQGGEGTDCSGFVFRTWSLKADGSAGYRRWDYDKDVHGPFYTWDYYSPVSADPFKQIAKSRTATTPMDAFVWYRGEDRHIALLYQEGNGSDLVVHAHNNSVGVEISEEIYRQYSDVKALTRRSWTLECYPKCPSADAPSAR